MKIFEKINFNYTSKLPFVVYKKPNENFVKGIFCKNDYLIYTSDFSESGFVFSPFDESRDKAILFPKNTSKIIEERVDFENNTFHNFNYDNDVSSRENHINLVSKAINRIKESQIEKIVISRKEEVSINDFRFLEVYKNLLQRYNNAFVYIWFHPEIGLWLGATPETLLEIKGNLFKTMSLAGTKNYKEGEETIWGTKEIEEQQLVTDFIENQVKHISDSLKIESAKTIKAGTLLHLRSKVEGSLKDEASLNTLLKALHPTPAVCGLPRNDAKKFILENESYDRTFYTGFLGEINFKEKSHLFVNLRCMNFKDSIANIYVGGGITKDSIPEKEWEETVSKTSTMKAVLNKKP